MRIWTLAFLLGIISLNFFAALPSVSFALFSLLTGSIGTGYGWYYQRRYLAAGFAICLGFGWALVHAQQQLHHRLPTALEGQALTLQGTVQKVPEQQGQVQHLEVAIDSATIPARLLRLSCRDNCAAFKVGELWQLAVKLKQPHGTLNPGSFDYEKWLFEHRIDAVGYVIAKVQPQRLAEAGFYPIQRLRQAIYQHLCHTLANHPMVGMITGLTVGIRTAITPSQWQVMQGTGTNHLMAIAGLHVGFVAGFAFKLMTWLWRRLGRLPLYLATPQAAAVAALLAAMVYSALAGFALPTQRAMLMLSVFLLSSLRQRQLAPWQAWYVALLLILLREPLIVLADSFWLSFGAVAMIIYGMSGRLQRLSKFWHWVKIQWVVSIGLLPLTVWFFHQAAFQGLLANAVAIPWVGVVVLPLSLLGVLSLPLIPTLADYLWRWAADAMAVIWQVLSYLASFKNIQWQGYIPELWLLLLAIIGMLILLAPRGWPHRFMGLFWILPLVFWKPAGPKAGELWFTLLDVGQGLAAVIRTQHHVLIFDSGPKWGDEFDMGQAVVVPFLKQQGVFYVDSLIISHGDNDHRGGAMAIIKALPVKQVLTSVPEYFSPHLAVACQQGQAWRWDGVDFQILYPPKREAKSSNDNSCVLKVSLAQHTFLLPGDIEKKSERYLLTHAGADLAAQLLIAPHHGSISSSTPNFIQAIHPRWVLFATGYRNRYRFPHPKVQARYRQFSAQLLDTASCGAISWRVGVNSWSEPQCYRRFAGHYWNR